MIRDLRPLAVLVAAMVMIDALWLPGILGWANVSPISYNEMVLPLAHSVDLSEMIFTILTMIVFATWILLAGQNLMAAGCHDLEFTPASRVWWFAVPIANLFKPFQGMRELWNASHEQWPHDANQTLVSVWWAMWLLKNYGGGGLRAAGKHHMPGLLWADGAIDIAAAGLALWMVFAITSAQNRLKEQPLSEIFA